MVQGVIPPSPPGLRHPSFWDTPPMEHNCCIRLDHLCLFIEQQIHAHPTPIRAFLPLSTAEGQTQTCQNTRAAGEKGGKEPGPLSFGDASRGASRRAGSLPLHHPLPLIPCLGQEPGRGERSRPQWWKHLTLHCVHDHVAHVKK